MECTNYRGISLLNTIYKVMSNILYRRLMKYTEKEIGNYQCGFRPDGSTVEQIFTLRRILQKTQEYNISAYNLFIYFKSAYDSTNRQQVYIAMAELNIPSKIIKLMQIKMKNTLCRIKIQSDMSQEFKAVNGLRQ